MNSGLMTVHYNDPEKIIDNPEYFSQYHRWILSDNEGDNIQISPTQISNTQMYGGLKYHVFTEITMLTYTRPVKCNVKIINVRKAPAKGFGLVIITPPPKNIIIPLCTS